MVGGSVIGIIRTNESTLVHVADCPHYPSCGGGMDCKRPQTCSVRTDETNQRTGQKVEIGIGDSFWWQSGTCYWTPKENRTLGDSARCGVDYDIPLKKIGYSH